MTRSTLRKLTLLGALYFAQGLPFGFFSQVVPVELRSRGWDLDKIGLTALLALPWALKFAYAPFVDRHWWPRLGRRRTWILAMQAAGVALLAGVAISKNSSVPLLFGATFALNAIAATQDIATDGLGVEMLDDRERGPANGLQVGAYRGGMVVGGGVLLIFADALGLRGMFAVMAVLTLLATLPVFVAQEPPLPPAPPADSVDARYFLRRPGATRVLALVFAYKFGESFAAAMVKPFLVDHHFDLQAIGIMIGTVGWIGGIAGALAGGGLVGRLGRKRSLIVFGIGQVITVAGYAVLALGPPNTASLYVWCTIETLTSAAATAALFTCMMDWSARFSSGSDYTIQASAVVIAQLTAGMLSGFSAGALGYATHFAIAVGLCVVAAVLAAALFPRERAA